MFKPNPIHTPGGNAEVPYNFQNPSLDALNHKNNEIMENNNNKIKKR